MKIYYIRNDKCVDIVEKLKTTNRVMTYAIPALMTGERLIDYYIRMSHGNVFEALSRVLVDHTLFQYELVLYPLTKIGLLEPVSNTMSMIIGR